MADLPVKEFNMHAATEVQPTHIMAETAASQTGSIISIRVVCTMQYQRTRTLPTPQQSSARLLESLTSPSTRYAHMHKYCSLKIFDHHR